MEKIFLKALFATFMIFSAWACSSCTEQGTVYGTIKNAGFLYARNVTTLEDIKIEMKGYDDTSDFDNNYLYVKEGDVLEFQFIPDPIFDEIDITLLPYLKIGSNSVNLSSENDFMTQYTIGENQGQRKISVELRIDSSYSQNFDDELNINSIARLLLQNK